MTGVLHEPAPPLEADYNAVGVSLAPLNANPFMMAQRQLEQACDILALDAATREMLRWPQREVHVQLPVRMDDGSVRVFHAFRVQYNDARGPCEGGIRFHPAETIDTVRALAAWMTCTTAIMDLPLGGGRGGIVCDPKRLSPGELERLSRAYVRQIGRVLGLPQDVPAPDLYTSPQIMAWMADEHAFLRGGAEPGAITGKPLPLGGSQGRDDAPARGAIGAVREAAEELQLDLKKATTAIQGYGSVGYAVHRLGSELLRLKVVAVSDSRGGIYNPHGLDAEQVLAHKHKTGSVTGFHNAHPISNDELLELDVKVLVPAALESVISDVNADNIKAAIVAELADGPTTPEADVVLHEKGAFVIPHLLCNAGGVTASYFEMVQNACHDYWNLAQVQQRLEVRITAAFHTMRAMAHRHRVPNRMAAYLVAVSRVAEAMKLRGWV